MLLTCLYKTAKLLRYYIEPCSGQTKDDKISICCFSTKHAVLRSKSGLCGYATSTIFYLYLGGGNQNISRKPYTLRSVTNLITYN